MTVWRTVLSINRNIVECKGGITVCNDWKNNRINRNIVECKDKQAMKSIADSISINRNIVECKVQSPDYRM